MNQKVILSQLQSPHQDRKSKRIGRGESSGWGKTAGRGQKGQKARSGGRVRPGFEGGQMPLFRRLPKFRQNNLRSAIRQIINIRDLSRVKGTEINGKTLFAAHLISHPRTPVKLLAMGEINGPLTVTINQISTAARTKIIKAGGKVVLQDL